MSISESDCDPKPCKIALTGAHGVGKTTLARELCDILRAKHGLVAVLTPEVPRMICDAVGDPGFFRRARNNALKQILLLYGQIHYETIVAAGDPDVIVCDRTVLDHWAYSSYLFGDVYEAAGILRLCERLVAEYCRTYHRLYRIPIEFPPADDGTREADENFQRAIEATILTFLHRHDIRYDTIAGTVTSRRNVILESLQLKMRT